MIHSVDLRYYNSSIKQWYWKDLELRFSICSDENPYNNINKTSKVKKLKKKSVGCKTGIKKIPKNKRENVL